ncbi:MAG: hypothetical protein JO289_24330 [Xanthobacteraceae bacterium]|nr:hypothetical protein [Xanthobacteraceae bacterium]
MSDSATILREPWPNIERQRYGAAFGIWIFLVTEMLFFGALFLNYAVNRSLHPEAFRIASHETDIVYGTANTLILLTSSLVMTLAERVAAANWRRFALTCLIVTASLGLAFLVVKGSSTATICPRACFRGRTSRSSPHRPSCSGACIGS